MNKLSGKVALVTGAGRGLGREISILFAEEGAKIGCGSKTKKYLDETIETIRSKGGEAVGILGDVSNPHDASRMVKETVNRFGRLDILVNNAGIDTMGSALDLTEENWNRLISINLTGSFLVSKYAIPEMMKSGNGSIIHIGSTAGLVGIPGWLGYCAYKGGIVNMTRAMALDLAPHKIRVNCVCPGDMKTPMFEAWLNRFREEQRPKIIEEALSKYPMNRFADPIEVARAVLYFASDDSSFATGSILAVDAGYTAQ
jgi:NAD(P)-dependent dehydrogenase (short-subunit alcohol dehydrogenase family)